MKSVARVPRSAQTYQRAASRVAERHYVFSRAGIKFRAVTYGGRGACREVRSPAETRHCYFRAGGKLNQSSRGGGGRGRRRGDARAKSRISGWIKRSRQARALNRRSRVALNILRVFLCVRAPGDHSAARYHSNLLNP